MSTEYYYDASKRPVDTYDWAVPLQDLSKDQYDALSDDQKRIVAARAWFVKTRPKGHTPAILDGELVADVTTETPTTDKKGDS